MKAIRKKNIKYLQNPLMICKSIFGGINVINLLMLKEMKSQITIV